MSDRAEFEEWYASNFNRRPTEAGYETDICWQAWQAARAQSGQGVEPVGIVNYADHQSADALTNGAPLRMAVDETGPRSIQGLPKGTKLYTRPQPAQEDPDLQLIRERDYWEGKATELAEDVGKLLGVEVGEHSSANCPVQNAIDAVFRAAECPAQQGSVPESVPSRDDLIQCLLATRGQSEGVAADAILWLLPATTPQPEGDGWVKCSERLPTSEDRCIWLYFKDHGVIDLIWRWDDEIGKDGETYWKPTGLKSPQPPQEGE